MVAVLVMGILVAACLSAIVFNQISIRKAKEQAIAMDFLTHYVENIKALPFPSLVPGSPINSLLNGTGGAPFIGIPVDGSWVSIDTSDYQMFHPDLLWLSNRHPKLQVILTRNNAGGAVHDVEFNVKLDWDSPLGKGGQLEVQVDVLRTKDVTTL
jgi:hypothetical protein